MALETSEGEEMNDPHGPRFTHDCPFCVFMGRAGAFDTYLCANDARHEYGVLARFGNEAGDYASHSLTSALATDIDLDECPQSKACVSLARRLLHEGLLSVAVDKLEVARRKALLSPDYGLRTCSVCGEPQFETPSGITCENGHGGAPSKEGPIFIRGACIGNPNAAAKVTIHNTETGRKKSSDV